MAAIVHSQMLKLYAGPRSISGSFGASPSQAVVTAYLSQPSCVLSANAEGVVEDYAPASTTIVVEVSGRTDTSNWTISTAKSTSVGTVSVTGATVSVSGLTDDAGWVDITASKVGYESVTRRFTLAKVRQKGGVRVATTLPANPSEVGGELAIFLDVADPALRGMYGWSGTAWVKTGELLNGSVTADKLAADAIQATKFASGIEPVAIVNLLPNVVGYTGPKLVFLTTDNKLYRYTGSSWVKELPAEDLTGQLVADQLASNSVTTGKIQAGAVTTDQLAAKAVTASKLVLTDTSNIYPDYDILDSSFYSGTAFTRVASTSLSRGAYALRIAANAAESRVESQWFQVEPSAEYFVELSAYQSISGTTGAAAAYIEFGSFSGGETTPTVTRSELVLRRVSTTSSARADAAVTTASNERKARLVFIREAGGTGVAEFGGPVIRRRNNAKLIVDGSIVATKIATDAVQTHHLLAGAVTAEKLTVNKLSAITADMGDVTAGTFTLSSTGYIRGGATNFATGAGFWMGYDAGTYKLRAGTPGSSGFEWTGSAFNVRGPDGSITISSGVVDWGKIGGAGKPENGATVGADWFNNVTNRPDPTSFLETFESGSVAQWTNHNGAGELSVVSVADSLTGGKVLRIGNNSGDDQAWLIHKQNIPFDPSALYRVRFRVRRTAGTGRVFLGLAGVAADGVTLVNTAGANASGNQHYVSAHDQTPGSAWTEYVGYVKGTAATGQTGTNPPVTTPLKLHQNVKYIRPLILMNFPSAAGTAEVDYCSIELMTDAMSWDGVSGSGKDALVTTASTALTNANAAQQDADAANAALADISDDNKLTPAEKQSIRKEWDAIYAERAGIRAQADSFGITTEKTNYDNAFQALGTYLNGGTAYTIGATPPSWITDANLATTTTIVGSTFRANWAALYQRRQELLNKISAEAAKKADWSNVSGANKPEDGATKNRIFTQATAPVDASNGDIWIDTSVTPSVQKMMVGGSWQLAATVGADFGRFNVTNTVLNEQFASGFTGWVNRSGDGEIAVYNNPANPYGSTDGKYVYFGNMSGNDQVWAVRTAQLFPYDPNKLYRMRVRCRQTGGSGELYIGFEGIAADGTTYVTWDGQNLWGSQHYFVASSKKLPAVNYTDPSTWTELVGYAKGSAAQSDLGEFPSYSNPCRLHVNIKYFRPLVLANYNYQPGSFDLDYVIIEEGTVDPGNLTGKITQSNVTTWIDNAAIGAAQIGSVELVGESAFKVRTNNTAGARMDMDSRRIKIFDSNGTLRVQLGDLTV